MLGNAFGNAHNEGDFGGDGFLDTRGSEWGPVFVSRLVSGAQVFEVSGLTHGTKMAVAFAPVSFTASLTLAKTGRPRCS